MPQSTHPILRALSSDALHDDAFDELLPDRARSQSPFYWTPLCVAKRAAALFCEHGARRILDVGCGPGKFCLVGAATQPSLEFVGIERRAHLVEVANALARRLGLNNVEFACGDAFAHSWRGCDGFYFFNPFWENVSTDLGRFDDSVELSGERLVLELARTPVALSGLKTGAIVITYHGTGTPIPSSYELLQSEAVGTDRLRVWRRVHRHEKDWYHVETEAGVLRLTGRDVRAMRARLEAELEA